MAQRNQTLLTAGAVLLAVAIGLLIWWDARVRVGADGVIGTPDLRDARRVADGRRVYDAHCAACHGAALEGQPNWTTRLPNGRLPAPPHDDSGHTWHHPNDVLFALTRNGLRPPYAPPDYASDMPAFGGVLTDDEIWNVLAYIQSRWSPEVRARHAELEREMQRQRH